MNDIVYWIMVLFFLITVVYIIKKMLEGNEQLQKRLEKVIEQLGNKKTCLPLTVWDEVEEDIDFLLDDDYEPKI